MGVLPTNRTKNNCSMTEEETVRREGKRSNNFPNRVGWLGYWLRTYSSKAHWDFSCKLSTWATSERPQASERGGKQININKVFLSLGDFFPHCDAMMWGGGGGGGGNLVPVMIKETKAVFLKKC